MSPVRPRKKRADELDQRRIKSIEMTTEDWEAFGHGVDLFNKGKFWSSHEAWELIWLRHAEDERLFFQGLIQLAAAYHHLLSGKNLHGFLKNLDKAREKLALFEPQFLGVSVAPLMTSIAEGKKEAERLGPRDLGGFQRTLIPKLQFQKPFNPDFLIESRSMIDSERFREGVALFNKKYYWEAHEVWEDIWRDEEGDAKAFAQAFVQIAAANDFMQRSKLSNALYLFEKARGTLVQYSHLQCGIDVHAVIRDLENVLKELRGSDGASSHGRHGVVGEIMLQNLNPGNGSSPG